MLGAGAGFSSCRFLSGSGGMLCGHVCDGVILASGTVSGFVIPMIR